MKILRKEDLGSISHLPAAVRKRTAEVIRTLDRIYGADRDHLNADGGWVEIIETRHDLEEFGGAGRLNARESVDHVGQAGSGWLEIFVICNNETGISVLMPIFPGWLPSELAAEMAAEASDDTTQAPSITAPPMRVRTGIYPLRVTKKLAGILEREIAASGCDTWGGVTVRFTDRNHPGGSHQLDPIEVVVSHSGVIRRLSDFAVRDRRRADANLERRLDFDLERGVLAISGSEMPVGDNRVLFDSWQYRLCCDHQRGAYQVEVVPQTTETHTQPVVVTSRGGDHNQISHNNHKERKP